MLRTLTVLLACATALAASARAQTVHEPVTWYVIAAGDGARLGHASLEIALRGEERHIIENQRVYLREQGGAPVRIVSRTVSVEDASGAVISIVETLRAGHYESRVEARIRDGAAHVMRQTPSGSWREIVALPPGVRFDTGEQLLADWRPDEQPVLAFDNFSIDAMAIERIVIEAGPRDSKGRRTALRRRYEGSQLRGVARLTLDDEGGIADIVPPMFGAAIHVTTSDRADATRRHPPYQVVPNMMTRSPFRISAAASRSHIRYRLAFRDDIAFALPASGEQRAHLDADAMIVDICGECGDGLPSDPAALADALRPTAWLQSDHPRLREIAAPVARLDISDARKMQMLLERARPYIENMDFNGHYSALDTITRRAGDCTEAAVLLAALGRAAGIPTRVASGLAYSRASYHGVSNAFLPHSWTLAYVDGRWRSFDLALNEFDSTHIAFTIGDGDARSIAAAGQLASLVRIDSLAEVRASGGN